MIGFRRLPCLGALLLMACTPPILRQGTVVEARADPFAFLVDGRTSREEVLLRFGTPTAHFEGERMLTYAFRKGSNGSWLRTSRTWWRQEGVPAYTGGGRVHNLVLVFRPDGKLTRHSLVVSERVAAEG